MKPPTPMKFYFSGVSSKRNANILRENGARRVVVDPMDAPNVSGMPFKKGLDNGAYKMFRKKQAWTIPRLNRVLDALRKQGPWEFVVCPDVIGDHRQSLGLWRMLSNPPENKLRGVPIIPVWQWGAPRSYLEEFLGGSELVGIGGLVLHMRQKNQSMLAELTELCDAHPGRFHVFGMNWLKALETLRLKVASADTSKWLDGARYGHVIFWHTRTGHLQQYRADVILKRTTTREERLSLSVQALNKLEWADPMKESAHSL